MNNNPKEGADLPAVRGRTVGDRLADLGIAVVATAPFAGGVAHLLEGYRTDRFERWARAVEDQLSELSGQLADDDRFLSLLQKATTMAVEDHVSKKAEMLAAALRGYAEEPGEWNDEVVGRMFLMIERLSPRHIVVMQMLNSVERHPSPAADPVAVVLSIVRKSIRNGYPDIWDGDPLAQSAVASDLAELNRRFAFEG